MAFVLVIDLEIHTIPPMPVCYKWEVNSDHIIGSAR